MNEARPRGLFAGLATLDVIHRVSTRPGPDEKITAEAQFVAAGGPAANAAVTFAALGGKAVLATALGRGTIAETIRSELRGSGVEVIDLAPDLEDAAPVSAVTVLSTTGERSVIGGDAAGLTAPRPTDSHLRELLGDAKVVQLDGHHPEIARAVLDSARDRDIPTVLDAGRWKPSMDVLVGEVGEVIASAAFRTPGAADSAETAHEVLRRGSTVAAATGGPGPVRWWTRSGSGAVAVPSVDARDTLGAGDVFHGAYAFALPSGLGLEERLRFAGEVAALRTSMVGPRSWLRAIADVPLRREASK